MADKRIDQLTAAPSTIPNSWVFAVANDSTGEAFKTTYAALAAQLIPVNNSIKVFYVDGNNTVNGDGSVTNPFKTIALAYAKVLGTGTPDNPQIQNVAISVSAYNYTTSQNIYLLNCTWYFQPGTQVTFTGTGYFVDTTSYANCNGYFKISGGLFLIVTQGGFIKNHGVGLSQVYQKNIEIEMNGVRGQTAVGSGGNPTITTPLIWLNKTTTGGGYSIPYISLKFDGAITSAYQTTIYIQNSARIRIYGGGVLNYGSDYSTGTNTTGHIQGCAIRYENNETGTRRYNGGITMDNIDISSGYSVNKIIHIEGAISNGYMRNCNVLAAYGGASAVRFMELGEIEAVGYGASPGSQFIVYNVRLDAGLTDTKTDVRRWVCSTSAK